MSGILDENEDLDYVSSSPLLDTEPPKIKVEDEVDLPILLQLKRMIDQQIANRSNLFAVTVDESVMSVQQQIAVQQAVVDDLSTIKTLIDTTIQDIKEKYKG